MTQTKIIAHRGASHFAPQNTKSAFKAAVKMQADGIETDLHLTKDKQLIVHHDYFIDAHSDGKGCIEFLTLEELRKYNFARPQDRQVERETITTLAETLEICRDMRVINLELKAALGDPEEFVTLVLKEVKTFNLDEKIIFSSFDPELLEIIKAKDAKWKVGLLTEFEDAHYFIQELAISVLARAKYPINEEVIKQIQENPSLDEQIAALSFKPEFLHPDYRSILKDNSLVKRMHEQGIGVNPYTVDEKDYLIQLAKLGCEGIITNRPDYARECIFGAK